MESVSMGVPGWLLVGWLVGIAAPTVPFPQSLLKKKKTECPADPMTQQKR